MNIKLIPDPSFRQGLPESRLQGCNGGNAVKLRHSHLFGWDLFNLMRLPELKSQGWQKGSHPCVLDTGNPCRYDDVFVS
jgi:hypothetical protein